jgi:aminomethyltransferase
VITALDSDGDALCEAADGLEFDIRNVTAEAPNLQLQGPESRSVLGLLSDADVASLRYYHCTPEPIDVAGEPVLVARCGYSGELGYELYCSPASAERLWGAILATGRVTPYGLDAVETLRQESGLIFIGYDYLVGETSPYEVNLDGWCGWRSRVSRPRGASADRRGAARGVDDVVRRRRRGAPSRRGGDRRGAVVGEVRSACLSPRWGG